MGSEGRTCVLIGPCVAKGGPGKSTIQLAKPSSTKSSLWAMDFTWNWQPSPHTSGCSWLEGGVSSGPWPFLPRNLPLAINMPSMVPRLFVLRGTCRLGPSCPQPPSPCLPPMLLSTQSLEGTETAGGWCVSTTLVRL